MSWNTLTSLRELDPPAQPLRSTRNPERAFQTPAGIRRRGNKAGIAAIPWPQESAFGNPKNGLKHRGKGATRLRSKLAAQTAPERR